MFINTRELTPQEKGVVINDLNKFSIGQVIAIDYTYPYEGKNKDNTIQGVYAGMIPNQENTDDPTPIIALQNHGNRSNAQALFSLWELLGFEGYQYKTTRPTRIKGGSDKLKDFVDTHNAENTIDVGSKDGMLLLAGEVKRLFPKNINPKPQIILNGGWLHFIYAVGEIDMGELERRDPDFINEYKNSTVKNLLLNQYIRENVEHPFLGDLAKRYLKQLHKHYNVADAFSDSGKFLSDFLRVREQDEDPKVFVTCRIRGIPQSYANKKYVSYRAKDFTEDLLIPLSEYTVRIQDKLPIK